VEYAEFDTERRRITRAWGRELTDPEQLAAAVERLREQAGTLAVESDRDRAMAYLTVMDDLVSVAEEPEGEHIRRASDVMMRSTAPDGTAAEQRARAEAGMAEIARIAAEAPTAGERDAVLEMNEPLAVILASHREPSGVTDAAPAGKRTLGADEQTAKFAADQTVAPARGIAAPSVTPGARPTASTAAAGPKAPIRDR
jgi:hypothetical protein